VVKNDLSAKTIAVGAQMAREQNGGTRLD